MEQLIWDLENAEIDLKVIKERVSDENKKYVELAKDDIQKALDRLYYVRDDENERNS